MGTCSVFCPLQIPTSSWMTGLVELRGPVFHRAFAIYREVDRTRLMFLLAIDSAVAALRSAEFADVLHDLVTGAKCFATDQFSEVGSFVHDLRVRLSHRVFQLRVVDA